MAGEADVIGGVAQGAAAGSAFGPWGAAIGGVIGGIGGLLGAGKKKKAKKYLKKANALRTETARLRSFAEQRQMLRQGQVAASNAIAAGVASGADIESSGTQGINASTYTQMIDNFLLGQELLNTQIEANQWEQKAGKAAAQYEEIGGIMKAGFQLTQLIPHTFGATNDPNFKTVLAQSRLPSEVSSAPTTADNGVRTWGYDTAPIGGSLIRYGGN